MKAKYFLPVAAVLFAACSEPTSPVANLEVSAGRQTQPPPSTAPVETFDNSTASLSAWSPALLTTSLGSAKMAPTGFLGRFLNEEVSLTVPAGMSTVTVSFDLYIIGTWDGAGQQGYGMDAWQIEVSKDGGLTRENVFHTSFSNQATKPQHFPKQITDGTSPADKGAYATGLLGYPKASGKYDVGDAIYKLKYTISNPNAGPLTLYFHTTTPLQSLDDESWGIDNVSISGS